MLGNIKTDRHLDKGLDRGSILLDHELLVSVVVADVSDHDQVPDGVLFRQIPAT